MVKKTAIDGGKLVEELEGRLLAKTWESSVSRVPQEVMDLMMLVEGFRKQIRVLDGVRESDSTKCFFVLAEGRLTRLVLAMIEEKLETMPEGVQAIGQILKLVREKVGKESRPEGRVGKHDEVAAEPGRTTRKGKREVVAGDSGFDSGRLALMEGEMEGIMRSLVPKRNLQSGEVALGDNGPDHNWKLRLRFEPFMKLSRRNPEFTPEQLMDSQKLRRKCAEMLYGFPGDAFEKTSAVSFYAWVAEKFREKPHSPWHDYLAMEALARREPGGGGGGGSSM